MQGIKLVKTEIWTKFDAINIKLCFDRNILDGRRKTTYLQAQEILSCCQKQVMPMNNFLFHILWQITLLWLINHSIAGLRLL